MNEAALQAQKNTLKRERFIAENKSFIKSCAYKATGSFVTESHDAYSIALIAFDEAISAYNSEKGDFKAFSALVIKRRLLDELRKDKGEIPTAPDSFEEPSMPYELPAVDQAVQKSMYSQAKKQADASDRTEAIRLEIEEATLLIAPYGFTFFDLVKVSPKSKATREACKKAIICLLRPGELYEAMHRTKTLPIKDLTEETDIPRKTIERHRKYIMAIAELLHGDFPHLNEYLRDIRKELMT